MSLARPIGLGARSCVSSLAGFRATTTTAKTTRSLSTSTFRGVVQTRPQHLRQQRQRLQQQQQFRSYSDSTSSYEHILTSTPKEGVGMITLNRPKALNALCTPLFVELNEALRNFDSQDNVGAIVLTGSEKAFAAGADIKEMAPLTFADAYTNQFIALWTNTIVSLRKPLISAVNGYALGGGCELALMTDIIYCSEGAKFGQPEITLGTIPGAGGSQRLTRAIGKSRAMELILTGKMWSGQDAYDWNMAARVFPDAQKCVDEAVATAAKIAAFSRVPVQACKEVVNKSQELPLAQGVDFERRIFHALFGSNDQKVGMKAFVEKDKNPKWTNS